MTAELHLHTYPARLFAYHAHSLLIGDCGGVKE